MCSLNILILNFILLPSSNGHKLASIYSLNLYLLNLLNFVILGRRLNDHIIDLTSFLLFILLPRVSLVNHSLGSKGYLCLLIDLLNFDKLKKQIIV